MARLRKENCVAGPPASLLGRSVLPEPFIAFADAESRTRAALREALLPKLISGEARVRNVERSLKERGL